MSLYCENKATSNIAYNPVQHYRTKHIEIDRHFIKEKLCAGLICIPLCEDNGATSGYFNKGSGQ